MTARAHAAVEVVTCERNLNTAAMVDVKNKVARLMNKQQKNVVLDMKKTKHVDLAGLGILVERIKKNRSMNGDIKLCNVQPQVYETFRLVGVAKLVESYRSQDDALRSFQVA